MQHGEGESEEGKNTENIKLGSVNGHLVYLRVGHSKSHSVELE